jgi:hypothetical protein
MSSDAQGGQNGDEEESRSIRVLWVAVKLPETEIVGGPDAFFTVAAQHWQERGSGTGRWGGVGVRATAAQDRSAWAMANDVAGRHMQGGAGGLTRGGDG